MERVLTAEKRAEAERLAVAGNLVGAVLLLRRATGATLREALTLARTWLPASIPSDDDGIRGEVLAIGPFQRALAMHLGYPAAMYEGTPEGAIVVAQLFPFHRNAAHTLAISSAFGIDPRDVNTHAIDSSGVDVDPLRTHFDDQYIEAFLALRAAGFAFYFHGGIDLDDA